MAGRPDAPPPRRALWRALRRRCPACGAGPLFDGWWRPHPVCPGCGLRPDRGEADYFLGALVVNFLATELVIAGLVAVIAAVTWPDPPWSALRLAALVAAVGLPILAYPVARMVWLAVDLQFRPPVREDDAPAPYDVS